jgi:hypothetical protein
MPPLMMFSVPGMGGPRSAPARPRSCTRPTGFWVNVSELKPCAGADPKMIGESLPSIFGFRPPCIDTPRRRSRLTETSMIATSTNTWKRCTSS